MYNQQFYLCQDIILDIIMKIEKVVRLLSNKTGESFEKMLEKFYKSRTYKVLRNTQSMLWAESSEFIVDEVLREWNKQ